MADPITQAAKAGLSMRGALAADRVLSLGWTARFSHGHLALDIPFELWDVLGVALHPSERELKRYRATIAMVFGRTLIHALERSGFKFRRSVGYIWAAPKKNPRRRR